MYGIWGCSIVLPANTPGAISLGEPQQTFSGTECMKPEAVTCREKKRSEFQLQESTKCNAIQARYDTYLVGWPPPFLIVVHPLAVGRRRRFI